jgi:hypothetical protein
MIDNSRNRVRLHRAIDALRLVSDDRQRFMEDLIHLPTPYGQRTIGRVLSLSRTIDTLERILSELHALLDQPPGVGSSESPRLVPRPVRPVDWSIAQPGLAVPGPGDGGPAAA